MCLAFLRFAFITLLWFFFSISVSSKKCEKDINQNFMSNKLNVWTLFCKKANLWTFGAYLWTHFFWNFKSKKYSLGGNCFLWIDFPVSSKYFLMKPCDTLMINSVLQNKSWVTWKNDAPRFFWEGLAISTTGTTLKLEGLTQYNAKSKNIWKKLLSGPKKKIAYFRLSARLRFFFRQCDR